MAATIIELLKLAGALYCVGIALMCICLYIIILVRLTDYYIHPDEEDHEL